MLPRTRRRLYSANIAGRPLMSCTPKKSTTASARGTTTFWGTWRTHTPCHCATLSARKYDFGERAKIVNFEMEMF